MKTSPYFAAFALLCLASSVMAGEFQLTGPTLPPNGTLPAQHILNGFGCTGGNLSPELAWTKEPAGTKSFALTVYDPDAPTGSGWWHWLVFNIPREVHSLPENSGNPEKALLPKQAIQARTDFGTPVTGAPVRPSAIPAIDTSLPYGRSISTSSR